MTMDMYEAQTESLDAKWLAGEKIAIRDLFNVQYFIEVEVGTPPVSFTVVPDTGSSNLWLYASTCWAIPCWYHDLYDKKMSSTYGKEGSDFRISYGSGGVWGTVSTDIVKIGNVTAPMGFGEVTWV